MTKKVLIFIYLLILITYSAKSQIKAVTEDGKEVTLYNNGTWQYDSTNKSSDTAKVLSFNKPALAQKLKKSEKISAGIWYNDKKWNVKPGANGDAYESFFTLKTGDLYAMFISERIEVPMDELVAAGKSNMEKVATDITMIDEGKRIINGKEMRYSQFKCKVRGVFCEYLAYYYSQDGMTIQFIGFTSQKLFASYKKELYAMLNGLVILDK